MTKALTHIGCFTAIRSYRFHQKFHVYCSLIFFGLASYICCNGNMSKICLGSQIPLPKVYKRLTVQTLLQSSIIISSMTPSQFDTWFKVKYQQVTVTYISKCKLQVKSNERFITTPPLKRTTSQKKMGNIFCSQFIV